MSDEVQDEIRQDGAVGTEGVQSQLEGQETPHEADGKQPDGVSHEAAHEGTQSEDEKHPLEPGGKRFNQVYARAKDAESKYQQERERAARLEGELEAMKRQPPATKAESAPARYTEAQLQAFVDEGKITTGQALAYQAETLRTETKQMVDQKIQDTLSSVTKQSSLQKEVERYRKVIPDIDTPGTEARQKLEKEFTYLVNMGYDLKDPKTEILAARAAFGDPAVLEAKHNARTLVQGRDTMQDIPASGRPKPAEKDPLKTLTPAQKTHYERMINKGVYKGWDEVKEELVFAGKN